MIAAVKGPLSEASPFAEVDASKNVASAGELGAVACMCPALQLPDYELPET